MSKFAMTLAFTPYHGGSRACEGGEERRGKPGGLSPKPRLSSRGTGFTIFMSLIKPPAIVLGSRNLGEADKLVTFFTPRHGKITGTAGGARRVRSRFGSSLEPFTHCQVILFQKTRDALYRIQQADILQSFQELREDLERIFWASSATSLTAAMVPEG